MTSAFLAPGSVIIMSYRTFAQAALFSPSELLLCQALSLAAFPLKASALFPTNLSRRATSWTSGTTPFAQPGHVAALLAHFEGRKILPEKNTPRTDRFVLLLYVLLLTLCCFSPSRGQKVPQVRLKR